MMNLIKPSYLLVTGLLFGLASCGFGNITRDRDDGGHPKATLTVSKNGDGSVASAPGGIDCGADCSHDYDVGTTVVLTATATADTTFSGWTGGGCTGTDPCSITLDADTTVEAAFVMNNSITVTLSGSGTGSVTSSPAGIDCGSTCMHAFAPGTMVTLTATAGTTSRFAGWGGACSGTSTCMVTVDSALAVTAMFAPKSCGDGTVDSGTGEECDTSLADTATCNGLTCKFSACGDMYVNGAAGEQCDGGAANTATCNGTGAGTLKCKTATCGDNYVNSAAGETCDGTSGANSSTCNGSSAGAVKCKAATCGDNYVNSAAAETCDASSGANTATCNGSGAGAVKCKAAACGDNYSNSTAGEQCDDGNNVTENCTYGVTSCTVCNSVCHTAAGATQYCNDGIVQAGFETCDDRNATCGSCSADCQTITSARATGNITVTKQQDMVDGDNFTLDDGFHAPLTFEYRTSGSAGAGHILVLLLPGDTPNSVRNKTVTAINGAANMDITASNGAVLTLVNLSNDHFSSLGNKLILANVSSANFAANGMTGGAGGDCGPAAACAADPDCASAVCQTNTCQ